MALSMATVLTPPVHAADSALAGIPKVGLVIEELSSDTKACGLTSEGLETSVRFVLGQMGPKVAPGGMSGAIGVPWLYLNANLVQSNTHCVYALSLQLNALARAAHNEAFIVGVAWEAGQVGVARKADIVNTAKAVVEEFAKVFAIAWKAHN